MNNPRIFFVNFQVLKEMLTVKQNVLQLAKEARFNEVDHENGNCLHCIVKSLWLRKSFNLMLIISQAKIKESLILDTKSSKEISDHADKILVDTSEFNHDMRRLHTLTGGQALKNYKWSE